MLSRVVRRFFSSGASDANRQEAPRWIAPVMALTALCAAGAGATAIHTKQRLGLLEEQLNLVLADVELKSEMQSIHIATVERQLMHLQQQSRPVPASHIERV